jgi:hypothetical protein
MGTPTDPVKLAYMANVHRSAYCASIEAGMSRKDAEKAATSVAHAAGEVWDQCHSDPRCSKTLNSSLAATQS